MKLPLSFEYTIFKYLWIILLIPKQIIQFFVLTVVLLLFIASNKNYRSIRINKEMKYFFCWLIIYAVSIVISGFYIDTTFNRVIADLLRVCAWIEALIFYTLYSHINLDRNRLKKYFINNLFISVFIVLLYLLRHGQNISFLGRHLLNVDYTKLGTSYRLAGFLEYATLNTTLSIILIPLVFILFKTVSSRLLSLFCLALPIYYSGSRTGLICILLVIGYTIYNMLHKYLRILFVIALFSIVIFSMFESKFLSTYLNALYEYRGLSNHGRLIIYQQSIDRVFDTNLFIGAGASVISSAGTWMGTHSSYLSYFYRTGIVGSIVIFLAFIKMFSNQAKVWKKDVWIYALVLAIFFVFETIDPGYIYIILFFSIMGLFGNNHLAQQMKGENTIEGNFTAFKN